MKKSTAFFVYSIIALFASGPPGFAEASSIVTAGRAQALPHNTPLALRGNIIFDLGNDRYLFRDSSGDMIIKIHEDGWEGLYIGPSDRIEIDGELKRDDRNFHIELDVGNIRRAAGPFERGASELQYLFIWPLSGRISSPYGNRRSPITGRQLFHAGIDIVAPMGSPVRAAMSGRVLTVGRDNVYGHHIIISHHSGYRTLYAHLSAARVRSGAYVETGEHIGNVGNTGLSTGPHLHFGVFRNGVTVNPRELLR